MQVKFTKDNPEYKLMVNWWNWFQKYADPEDNDKYWNKAIEDGSAVWANSDLKEFGQDLVAATLTELRRRAKHGTRTQG